MKNQCRNTGKQGIYKVINMAKRLKKGVIVIVKWIPSYYRGYRPPEEGIYLGKIKGKYKVDVGRGIAYLPRKMIKVK